MLLPLSLDPAGHVSTAETVLFWILATIMVLAALGLLFARKAIYAAMCVVLIMVSLAFIYVAQEAPFLGVVQVVVYTGAVMMLFLFVLMLVGVDISDSLKETIKGQRVIGAIGGLGLAVVLIGAVLAGTYPVAQGIEGAHDESNPTQVASVIFSKFVFTLEITGVLLIIAAVGAMVLTHRTRLTAKVGQRERGIARVARGEQVTPYPAPGVYARHNSADTPALDPLGRPIEQSVASVLRIRGQVRSVTDAAELPAADALLRAKAPAILEEPTAGDPATDEGEATR